MPVSLVVFSFFIKVTNIKRWLRGYQAFGPKIKQNQTITHNINNMGSDEPKFP